MHPAIKKRKGRIVVNIDLWLDDEDHAVNLTRVGPPNGRKYRAEAYSINGKRGEASDSDRTYAIRKAIARAEGFDP